MEALSRLLSVTNEVLWHPVVLFVVLGTGLLFALRTRGSAWSSLTHGVAIVRGRYDDDTGPGAVRHFQALSAALSATVGLGNIGGVALAIGTGGPGAVFWMWVIGLVGMSLKSIEVTLSMLHRDTSDSNNPHGGPMFVAARVLAARGRPRLGRVLGGVFVATLLVSSVTGGNMFQAWNVAELGAQYFGMPRLLSGVLLAAIVAAVILGGIHRIGAVAGRLVPTMCGLYLLAAVAVLACQWAEVPAVLSTIVRSAFAPAERQGAFLGAGAGFALMWGMKRALFSSEAGQGSSPIAHCAAKTNEPVREGVVAGLEPFIDTLVVCTLTALVLLTSGVWRREPDALFAAEPQVVAVGDAFSLAPTALRTALPARPGAALFTVVRAPAPAGDDQWLRLPGRLTIDADGASAQWQTLPTGARFAPAAAGVWLDYRGAALTALAFDQVVSGMGKWLITIAAWLFAISTMISWSYYGEQGLVFLGAERKLRLYRVAYCALIIVATIPGWLQTDAQLDALTSLGTGVMLWANVPLLLWFGGDAVQAWRRYHTRQRHR
ncbi:MAG: amino acid carrier protein [Planctomycetota bacterium]